MVPVDEHGWFDSQMGEHHYLGAGRPVGDYLRQAVYRRGEAVALLAWGPACYALKDRDRWVGWGADRRAGRLKLVVQNRRFLLLVPKGSEPNLASAALAAALRALPGHWEGAFGYRPLLAESFTDPEQFEGTCYKASGWEPVGMSAGNSRHRADFYVPNGRPKRLWVRELRPGARGLLRAEQVPAECARGLCAPPSGALPLNQGQMLSLAGALRAAPDPRAKNTRFRAGAVLALVAMALLAGRRDIAAVARFAQTLTQKQRRALGLPLKKGTGAFYQVPGYSVFYQVLTRMDARAFAKVLSGWLQARAGTLPRALAMDGKMIRDHVGVLTVCGHGDGAPVALAIYDQKEGKGHCEMDAAAAPLAGIPSLDGSTLTADALHCQRPTARTACEKGGGYLLQIKANQPGLLKHAEALDALGGTPFFKS